MGAAVTGNKDSRSINRYSQFHFNLEEDQERTRNDGVTAQWTVQEERKQTSYDLQCHTKRKQDNVVVANSEISQYTMR